MLQICGQRAACNSGSRSQCREMRYLSRGIGRRGGRLQAERLTGNEGFCRGVAVPAAFWRFGAVPGAGAGKYRCRARPRRSSTPPIAPSATRRRRACPRRRPVRPAELPARALHGQQGIGGGDRRLCAVDRQGAAPRGQAADRASATPRATRRQERRQVGRGKAGEDKADEAKTGEAKTEAKTRGKVRDQAKTKPTTPNRPTAKPGSQGARPKPRAKAARPRPTPKPDEAKPRRQTDKSDKKSD